MRRALLCLVVGVSGCKFPELPPLDDGDGGGPDADLTQAQPLVVAVTGDGTVTSNPAGIDCGSTCMAEFAPSSSVELSASPSSSSVFEGWSGDCTGRGSCSLTMDGARNVGARFALHGSGRWVNQISFAQGDYIAAVRVDAQGSVVIAGVVDDGGGTDVFVAKYRAEDGEVIWTRHIDTPDPGGSEQFGGMAVDGSGNVYVAVGLQGNGTTVTYGPGATAVGDVFFNIVVLRLAASDGLVEWARQWGGTSVDTPSAVAITGNDLYVVGKTSSNPATFDSKSFAGQTGDGFVVRASAQTGAVAELKRIPGSVNLNAVAVNGNNVVVVGSVGTAITVEAGCGVTLSGTGKDALMLALTGSTLSCQWARNYGSNVSGDEAELLGVAPFPVDGWIIAGRFEGSLSGLTPSPPTSLGDFDAVVARISSGGDHQWSFRYGGTAAEVATAVATTPEGNIVVAGGFAGPSLTLGSSTVTGASNVFITRMSSAPVPTNEWAVSLGGDDGDYATAVAVAPDGSVYSVASFNGMTTVAGTPLAAQAQDAWIAALVR